MLILAGLGDDQSNRSAEALDETISQWLNSPSVASHLDSLLLARGFAVGVDASLVTVTRTSLIPAASGLQFTLVGIALALALLSWLLVSCLPADQWSHTPLWNLERALMGEESTRGKGIWRRLRGGDFTNPPEVTLTITPEERVMRIAGRLIRWSEPSGDTPDDIPLMSVLSDTSTSVLGHGTPNWMV